MVVESAKITICASVGEFLQIRPKWEEIVKGGQFTIFQNFDLNLLAAQMFADREQPHIICAETPNGAAIIPAVLRHADNSIRLLGEELFDYRCFLHCGNREALRSALSHLAQLQRPLEIVAVRESERTTMEGFTVLPFSAAPSIYCQPDTAEKFAAEHLRLARNMRRLNRLGFEFRSYNGTASELLRSIYQRKAEQSPSSLFHDPARIEFIVRAAALLPDVFEVYTLEDGLNLAAALVTLRDGGFRRFYTACFAPELAKHSPALVLIYEVTRQSLEQGLSCDYMTGEQDYKMRLATATVPLHRVQARAEDLRSLAVKFTELPIAG